MRGGDGVPRPAAGADFFGTFFFFCAMFYLFSRNSPVLRPCYHALRQPVGAADRALLHN